MENRRGTATRKTGEVDIEIEIHLDEPGKYEISINTDKKEPGFWLCCF